MKVLQLLAIAALPIARAQIRGHADFREAIDADQEKEEFNANEVDHYFYKRDLGIGGSMGISTETKGSKGAKGSKGSKSHGSKGSKSPESKGSKDSKGSKGDGKGKGGGKGSKEGSESRASTLAQKPKIEDIKDKQRIEKRF
ncbi:hypothetical protein IV203_016657 [Nitzschia inconspicua]|uniref:Glycine-rich protein n=1 Tax=Nitzschia inconspicua TaxID=303405 RepID=A0A9K3PHK8_9STRA|nr:hypothetical protein IV203_016657 [Nitzschia inconspicua]